MKPRFSCTGRGWRPDLGEEREVRHVAGADPKDVGVGRNQIDVPRVEDLGHERKLEFLAGFGHQLESGLAQSLERIGRGPRLEGVAPQHLGARQLDRLGRPHDLVAVLGGAGPGDRREVPAPEFGLTRPG